MEREWLSYPRGALPTPLGPLDFAFTEARHVSLTTGINPEDSPSLVINSVPYQVHVHLYRQPDGTWNTGDRRPFMNRIGQLRSGASDSAYRKLVDSTVTGWTEFMAAPDAELYERDAELAHLNNQIMSAEEDLSKEMKKVHDIEATLADLTLREQDVAVPHLKRGGFPGPKDWSPKGRIPVGDE